VERPARVDGTADTQLTDNGPARAKATRLKRATVRILVLYNPIAGAGRAAAEAESLSGILREAGHDPFLKQTERDRSTDWLSPSLEGVDLLVVVGGDGAMRLAVDPAARTGTPFYPYPLGTENLFAREFGVVRKTPQLLDAVRRFEVRRIDLGTVGGQSFLLMVSMGIDAAMVRDLAAARRGGISHFSYVIPGLRQLIHWRASRLTVHLDDEQVVREQHGFVVIGNSRQYAVRLNPAARASMTDGLLDVVFFPCSTGSTALAWWIACGFRWHVRGDRVPYRRGKRVLVRSDPAHVYQLDGDDPGPTSPASELSVGVRPGAVPVLVPA
jgi:diacylglycerol kinase family enzyme